LISLSRTAGWRLLIAATARAPASATDRGKQILDRLAI